MRVLVACEFSGVVRSTFADKGHDAWSCDLRPSLIPGQHWQEDVLKILERETFDLMIAHPPCTHLAVSGARWFKDKVQEQEEALEFVKLLLDAPVPKIALENPVSIISSRLRKPDQIVQPWWFGDEFTKTTCLWLKGLPKLIPSQIVGRGEFVIHGGKRLPKWYSNRERDRSITFPGLAKAMAEQWG